MNYQDRLHNVIPGGAHTYSRGDDQFPYNAPPILERAQGAYIFDKDGNKYLDYGMGLRAVTVGYSDEEINKAAIEQINNGNCLTRPSLIELKAAETIVELITKTEKTPFRFATQEMLDLTIGQEVTFSFDSSKVHLF